MTTEDKIRLIAAKVRNLCYYRLVVEESLEDRFRCQYIHQLRGLRDTILITLLEIPNDDPRRDWLRRIAKIIPSKVKSNECLSIITKLSHEQQSGT